MNHLNSSYPKDIITQVLQEILVEDPNFFLTDRLSVLTWKSKKVKGALVTKVGNLRYLGCLRKDSKGQDYWKYKLLKNSSSELSETPVIQPNSQLPESKPVETNSSAVDLPAKNSASETVSVEESEQVKKFREKFGEFSAKQKYGTPNQSEKTTQ